MKGNKNVLYCILHISERKSELDMTQVGQGTFCHLTDEECQGWYH